MKRKSKIFCFHIRKITVYNNQLFYFTGTSYIQPERLYKPCTYHDVLFSTNMAYFLLECLGPGIPTVTLYATNNKHVNISSDSSIIIPIPKPLMVLQNNTKLYVSSKER